MKKNILALWISILFSTIAFSQVTISPATFNVTDAITITVSFPTGTCNTMGTAPVKVYMHSGIGDDTNAFGFAVVGNWGTDDGVGLMTNNGNGTWSKTITPSTYFNLNSTQQANATKLGMVFRNTTGSQTLKLAPSCSDFIFNVGQFQVSLTSPTVNSSTVINSGGSINITASNTNGNANYDLKANGTIIPAASASGVSSYSYTPTNITSNQSYELVITQGAASQSKKFNVIVNPGTITQAIPTGLEDGINYNSTDLTKATLVLDAPGKDFVYVAGSFNNYQPNTSYAMRKDGTNGKFWLELTGLQSGVVNTYQYWVVDQTPTANSPALVKTADPYSTLVLSPFDDPYISAVSYPNIPTYPAGQEREVTVLQTGQTPYAWSSATTNFVKPSKDNLVVYEVLIRDFDAARNFQTLINKIDYFKNLKINAIELMPVMEYEGNEGWGYNPSFHLALDKFYGTKAKMQEFIDLCHQNGIAVILDVALNHAFGRNPMVRMWMKDPDGDGWGDAASDNPYFNEFAKHSYGVGNDFNHASAMTKYYTKRVIKQWVQEFKIDGFRWDLTKGFTQACSSGDDTCTNAYQADRVAVLKDYADYSWSLDPNHYVIFEHLGIDSEEQQWANYRISETPSKGVMMWGEMTYPYTQLIEGYSTGADISRMGYVSRGFTGKRLMGYPESHDKDRLVYSAFTYGNGGGASPVAGNLNNALTRMSSIGAISLLIPGPKMIWHFADLGMGDSIYTCTDGTVNTETDTTTGDCKLATKPQPQWVNNWLGVATRSKIYNDWAKMIDLKKNNPVFNGSYSISPDSNNIRQRVYVYDNSLPASQLKNVVILANFSVAAQNVIPDFPYTGTWVNLMDNTTINVTSTSATLSIEAGGFRIFGNQAALKSDEFNPINTISLSPNPASTYFTLNMDTEKVQIFSITGQLVKSYSNLSASDQYLISDLNKGIYLVKVTDSDNHEKTLKLIKE
ncbi:alpha-amylase family glycosyl hydrolase [Flavobacterium sp. SUN052]|uniref:alpha-amylase family glycosyl hydrolase n=1 Tax=Flavobacterium sp. SUN052 TaxID=3002441 RepID=UPI00237DA663|nr:alpha-amylase family glycosyl hydrolase [Flavobacterium sp. SUN052]MEC4004613.1 alpha-amylase family glycosyl hydrolase [Flavobacterium sp. SUN052]